LQFEDLKVLELRTGLQFVSQQDIRLVLTQGVGLAGLTALCKLKVLAFGEPVQIVRLRDNYFKTN